MSSYPESFDHMLAAWNETNLEKIRGHLERSLAPEIHFVDPSIETRGLDEFEANVRGFRQKYPNAVCRRSSGIDGHHQIYRYAWEILNGDELFLLGFDVVTVDENELVVRVEGFFGPLPELN